MSVIATIKKSIKIFVGEYKQVKWPTLRTTINLTVFVLLVSAIITLIILGIDTILFDLRNTFVIK